MPSPLKLPLVLFGLAILAMACEQVPTDDDSTSETTALYHHRPDHAGGPGGDDGGGPKGSQPVLLTITGGIVAGPNLTEISEENNRRMRIEDIGGASFVLTDTHAAAVDELTNPANPICEFRPADGPMAVKQALVDGLQSPRQGGILNINKRDDRGIIAYNSPEYGAPWLTMGFNTQTGKLEDRAALDYQGTDPEDASLERRYLFQAGTGIWRTLIANADPSGDVQDLICVNQDEFLAVVVPVAP